MILPAIKSAILRCTGVVVSEVFSSTDQIAIEMADLANEVATDIAKSHDWRNLTKIATLSGTSDLAYSLPDDFDRMTLKSEIDDSATWFWGYEPFESVNEWLRWKSGQVSLVSPGGWIILGGKLNFYPAPIGEAEYPYISNQWAKSEVGAAKSAFEADNDSFALDNRLLELGLIWRWNHQKGQEYAEDMATFEMALAQAQGRDKGSRVLRTPGRRITGSQVAYSARPVR